MRSVVPKRSLRPQQKTPHRRMRYVILVGAALGASVLAAWLIAPWASTLPKESILAAFQEGAQYGPLTIRYPPGGTIFPPEIVPPVFRWEDGSAESDAWVVAVDFLDGQEGVSAACLSAEWMPSDEQWEAIKRRSVEQPARVSVLGVNRRAPKEILSAATITITTSKDPVAAPIFYREVDLPFVTSVRDPAAHIRWRFGAISSREQPPIVLDRLPVCANCHSFSADGSLLGMDIDYANDKGSYALEAVKKEMVLDPGKIITWSDYRREDGETTFGLLSQVSPDGRYVASTVKDQSVFVPVEDLTISQLFFPIKGILAIYDRQGKEFHALPGADDPQFVQSNPSWSPDGKHLVFARAKAYRPNRPLRRNAVLLRREDCEEFLDGRQTIQFDLYRIAFNGGQGGKAEPLQGASGDGMSNYFGRYSPDGKWIVFCKAKSFMLLQPDSRLYIVPAEGGEARPLECNTPRMNSWHSWSPNGRWLVFSSKAFSPYTQLFLTHIDEQGESSAPVVLSRFSAPDRAANIPEFVCVKPGAIEKIAHAFLDDNHYFRAAFAYLKYGRDPASAAPLLRKSLEMNPQNTSAHLELASILTEQGKLAEARDHIAAILTLAPNDIHARHALAQVLVKEGRPEEAEQHCRRALDASPNSPDARLYLGQVLVANGKWEQSVEHVAEALRLKPNEPVANYLWGYVLFRRGESKEAAAHYRRAVELDAEFVPAMLGLVTLCVVDRQATVEETKEALALAEKACDLTGRKELQPLRILAGMYAKAGQFGEAAKISRTALDVARAAGDQDSARKVQQVLAHFEKLEADSRRASPVQPKVTNHTSASPDLPSLPGLPETPEGAAAKARPDTPATKTAGTTAEKPDAHARRAEAPSGKP